jgi:colicin import membrane protein
MARKLKTYLTSLGFFDLAIAAPSMKAALEAWGSRSNLFHQGMAREVDDPAVVAATLSKPGVILKRPIGSSGPFREQADLPARLPGDGAKSGPNKPKLGARATKPAARPSDDANARESALAFERAQQRRQAERRKEEAAAAKLRERQQRAIARAEAALDRARREHDSRASTIAADRAALEKRSQAEQARWDEQRRKLEVALQRARH